MIFTAKKLKKVEKECCLLLFKTKSLY